MVKKYLNSRNVRIATIVGGLLLGGVAVKAIADDGGHRGWGAGHMTLERMLEKANKHFDATDTNNDSILTVVEVRNQINTRITKQMEKLMNKADSNGDGLITSEDRSYDIIASKLRLEGDITADQLETALVLMATEKHGSSVATLPLTRAEMEANITDEFSKLDTDGNGIISRNEHPGRHGGKHRHGNHRGDKKRNNRH